MTVNQFLLRGGLPGKQTALPIECGIGGAKVTNSGPLPVYYRDEQPVSSVLRDGSLAVGASANLYGAQFFVVDQGTASSAIDTAHLTVSELPAAGSGTFFGLSDVVAGTFGNEMFPVYDAASGTLKGQAGRTDAVSVTDPLFGAIPDTGSAFGAISAADWTAAQQNMWRIQAALNYAAATDGKHGILVPAHTFRMAYPSATVQTNVTVDPVLPSVLVCDDVSGFPDPVFMGGPVTVKVGNSISSPSITYTGLTATTLIGVLAVGSGFSVASGDNVRYGTFPVGSTGFDGKQEMVTVPSGVRITLTGKILLDYSALPEIERNGRPLFMGWAFGSEGTAAARRVLTQPGRNGYYWIDTLPADQPNTVNNLPGTPDQTIFPGKTLGDAAANTYQYLDRILVGTEACVDPDSSANRGGEILEVSEWFRSRLSAAAGMAPAATTMTLSAQNSFELPPLPNSAWATTVSGTQSSSTATLTVGSTAGFPSVGELDVDLGAGSYALVAYTGKTATTFTGCTCSTVVSLPDTSAVQFVARFIIVTARRNPDGSVAVNSSVSPQALTGGATLTGAYQVEQVTAATATGSGSTIYNNGLPTLNVKRRAVNGTTAVWHYDYDEVIVVPPPGRVNVRVPLLGANYYPGAPVNPDETVTLAVAAGTSGSTLTVTDAREFQSLGRALIDSEIVSWTSRDSRTLYGVTRAQEGTTAASHTTSAKVIELPRTSTLSAGITNADVTLPVTATQGAFLEMVTSNGTDPGGFGANGAYVTIDNELIFYTGVTLAKTAGNGNITLSGALAATDTSFAVNDATNLAASGLVKIGPELIAYSSVSGNTLTVRNGVAGRGIGGTGARAAVSGAQVRQITALTGGVRGVLGTAAASHLSGATVTRSDAAFVRKLTMNTDITVDGGGVFAGQRTYNSRAFGSAGNGENGPDPVYGTTGQRVGALRFRNCERVRITGVRFEDIEQSCIRFVNTQGVLITNNFFDGNLRMGIGSFIQQDEACQDHIIASNVFKRARHSQATNDGTGWGVPRRILHIGNHAKDMLMGGWTTHTAGEHHDFFFNTIEDCGEGIQIQGVTSKIIGNTIRRSANGIFVTCPLINAAQVVIADNTIEYDRADAISVIAQSPPTGGTALDRMYVTISNNAIFGGRANGIRVDSTALAPNNPVWENVIIDGNRVGVESKGILVASCSEATITGNVVRDVADANAAISLSSVLTAAVTGNVLKGRYAGASASHRALELLAVSDVAVTGNVGRNFNKGLFLDDSCVNVSAFANRFPGCTTAVTRGAGTGHVFTTADNGGAYNL